MKTDLVMIGLSFLGGSIFTWLFTGGIKAEIAKLRAELRRTDVANYATYVATKVAK